jgi:hypothetical protein
MPLPPVKLAVVSRTRKYRCVQIAGAGALLLSDAYREDGRIDCDSLSLAMHQRQMPKLRAKRNEHTHERLKYKSKKPPLSHSKGGCSANAVTTADKLRDVITKNGREHAHIMLKQVCTKFGSQRSQNAKTCRITASGSSSPGGHLIHK